MTPTKEEIAERNRFADELLGNREHDDGDNGDEISTRRAKKRPQSMAEIDTAAIYARFNAAKGKPDAA